MRDYPVKRKNKKILKEGSLKELMEKYFENVSESGEYISASYGAMKSIKAKFDGNALWVETETDPSVSDDVALDTVKVYNKFLEEATGYTAKERKKLLNKLAKEGE
jgi:hypothetical protein